MPGRDGTGPSGAGPRTGRGWGICQGYAGPRFFGDGSRRRGYGSGFGCGRGFGYGRGFGIGKGFYPGAYPADTYNKESLTEYQDYLAKELQSVKQEMENNK